MSAYSSNSVAWLKIYIQNWFGQKWIIAVRAIRLDPPSIRINSIVRDTSLPFADTNRQKKTCLAHLEEET
ncbi:unnamed protein product [Blepharisma stoltei]|uniref:Uncharacterized protein n=1 Tax=Blepharisma stoltei TaxID=1481888 RepID=A0AAU9K0Q0_9CILI|nr:unnamed protein product [Blepharisma stoltei]